ncbi:MAG: response regulator [Balneolaceae bacterium]
MSDLHSSYNQLIARSVYEKSELGCLLFSLSPDGLPVLQTANHAFGELARLDLSTLAEHNPNLLGGLNNCSEHPSEIDDALNREGEYHQELLLSRSDGSTFWCDVHVRKVTSPDYPNPFILTTLKDVSERKKSEARLKKAEELAEESLRARERFVASMGHEIRTPMTGVIGMAELLAGTEMNQQQREYLESIRSSAGSLVKILNDVIEFSTAGSGKIRIERKPFKLQDTLRHLASVYSHQTEKQNVEFNVNTGENLPPLVIGDENRFLQILMQLVGNAFKFTEAGYIRVHVSGGEVKLGMVEVTVTIEDSGIGIPAELTQSIYESFSKASKSTMSRYGGTGLGLAIVKHLTDLMDGRIAIESQEGSGTTCRITLPFELPGDKPDETLPKETNPYPGREKRALIVDDHPVNRRLLEGMLKRAGLEYHSAEDGQQAIDRLNQESYDFILMDVHMPGLSGIETTRIIRSELEEPKRSIPVIAVTASTMDSDIENCRQVGMNDFLAKPFSFDDLISKIGQIRKATEGTPWLLDTKDPSHTDDFVDDVTRFEALEEMTAGDSEMMLDMLELFLAQTPGMIQQLQTHYREENWTELGKVAHTLKPTFSYLGIESAHPMLLSLETCKDRAPAPDSLPQIKATIQALETITSRAFEEVNQKISDLQTE